jgi:pimeloyl-ACP methyl ester carboxylesterase
MNLIEADRDCVTLSSTIEIRVDTAQFEIACGAGNFAEAMRLAANDFLAGFSISDCEAFDEWAYFRREGLRGRLVHVLERLISSSLAGGEAHAAIEPAIRLVSLDPFAEAAHRQLIRAHLMAGDVHTAERAYDSCAKLLADELGVSPAPETRALLTDRTASLGPSIPNTRYVARGDVHLAYQTLGQGPPDIVFVPGFVSHVERVWEDQNTRRFLAALAAVGRLIIFDRRGVGLSDRIGVAPTVEATAEDILCVLDHVGSSRVVLIGASEGGPGSIRFAVDHPQRLAGLILYGSLARGSWTPNYPYVLTSEQYSAWLRDLVAQWGGPCGIETFAPSLVGDRATELWWAGLLRSASSPGAVRAVLESLRDSDVTGLLSAITTPTLVLHRSGDRAVRVQAGRHLAAHIAGAKFVELDGNDHWPWAGDQDAIVEQISIFVRSLLRN